MTGIIDVGKEFAVSLKRVSIASLAALGCVALLFSSGKASAAQVGLSANCAFVNPNRLQCNIPILAPQPATILYASMQCGSTGPVAYVLQQFQVLTMPPGSTSEVAYQIPIGNRASLGGVVNTGAEVNLHVTGNTASRALIDLVPAPTGKTQCTVSVSAAY